jgi:hypothetical protein
MSKSTGAPKLPARTIISPRIDRKVEEFAEDLGHVLGTARAKADSWLSQRQAIAQHLEGVRDTAIQLLQQLGISSAAPARRPAPAAAKRGPGRPPKAGARQRKRRRMSAEAREKIAAAQRARWARQKAGMR